MFSSIKKISVILASLSIALSSHAYIYQIDVWEKRDNSGKVVQELYCMSDFHGELKHSTTNKEQQAQLLDQCKKVDNTNTLFIVEDLGSDISHPKLKEFVSLFRKEYFTKSNSIRCTTLSFLADLLREQGHNAINIEDRHVRSADYSFCDNITIKDIIEEFEHALSSARAFCTTDGPILERYYTEILAQLSKGTIPAELLNHLDINQSYHHFLKSCSPSKRSLIKANLKVWGSEILDINTLHHIYNAAPSINKICVIMGAAHISNISTMLPALGYTKTKTIGDSPITQDEMDDCMSLCREWHYLWLDVLFRNNTSALDAIDRGKDKWDKINIFLQKIYQAKPLKNTDFSVIAEKRSMGSKKSIFSFLRRIK